ncbi:MAG: nucleotidyltransferase domain-containing protein [Patescibacteria group bacterium]
MKISQKQKEQIAQIAREYYLKLILIFGSQVSKKTHRQSDLDIGIWVTKDISFEKHLLLISRLKEIFHINPDVTILNEADPLLLQKILENNLVLYGNPRDLAEFKMYAFFRFCDFKPYFDIEEKTVSRFINNLQ